MPNFLVFHEEVGFVEDIRISSSTVVCFLFEQLLHEFVIFLDLLIVSELRLIGSDVRVLYVNQLLLVLKYFLFMFFVLRVVLIISVIELEW